MAYGAQAAAAAAARARVGGVLGGGVGVQAGLAGRAPLAGGVGAGAGGVKAAAGGCWHECCGDGNRVQAEREGEASQHLGALVKGGAHVVLPGRKLRLVVGRRSCINV